MFAKIRDGSNCVCLKPPTNAQYTGCGSTAALLLRT